MPGAVVEQNVNAVRPGVGNRKVATAVAIQIRGDETERDCAHDHSGTIVKRSVAAVDQNLDRMACVVMLRGQREVGAAVAVEVCSNQRLWLGAG